MHFHVRVGVKNLTKYFFAIFCGCKSLRQRYKATNMSVSSTKWNFLLAYENKLDKEFRELKQQNKIVIWVQVKGSATVS